MRKKREENSAASKCDDENDYLTLEQDYNFIHAMYAINMHAQHKHIHKRTYMWI